MGGEGKRLEGGTGGWSWPMFMRAPCYLNRWAWILPARSRAYCIPHDEWGLVSQLCRQLSARRLFTQVTGKSFLELMSHTQAATRALKLHVNHVSPHIFLFLDLDKQKQKGLNFTESFPLQFVHQPQYVLMIPIPSLWDMHFLVDAGSVWNEKLE